MKKKFLSFIFNLILISLSVILVAFHYSKNEEKEMSFNEALKENLIKVNFISSESLSSLETIVLNKTNMHLKIKIPKGTLLKIASKRLLFLRVIQSDFIEVFPHSTVEQIILGRCFQKSAK